VQTFVSHISTYVPNLLLVRYAPRLSALNDSKYATIAATIRFGRIEWPRKPAGFCMVRGPNGRSPFAAIWLHLLQFDYICISSLISRHFITGFTALGYSTLHVVQQIYLLWKILHVLVYTLQSTVHVLLECVQSKSLFITIKLYFSCTDLNRVPQE
jgi:hypothetical protein